jgi:hypothetical protein
MEVDWSPMEADAQPESGTHQAERSSATKIDDTNPDNEADSVGWELGLARRDAAFQIEQYRDHLIESKHPSATSATNISSQIDLKKDGKSSEGKEREAPNAGVLGAIDPNKPAAVEVPAVEALDLWFPIDLPADEIVSRRAEIKRRLLSTRLGGFVLDVPSVEELVCHYNGAFFGGRLFEAIRHQQSGIEIKIGGVSMKKGWAGVCMFDGAMCTIGLHPGLSNLQFRAGHREDVNGIEAKDILDCVQLVLEHELCHLLIQVCLRVKEAAHGPRFKALARGLFGHPFFTHAIGVARRGPRHEGGNPAQLVQEGLEAERKRGTFKAGVLILLAPTDLPAAVLTAQEKVVTIMHGDGRIVEKIPYKLLRLLAPDGILIQANEAVTQLESVYARFAQNKRALSVGALIRYAAPDGTLVQARVVAKKPLGVVVQTSANTTLILPFHTVLPQ